MTDKISKILAFEDQVKLVIIQAADTVKEAARRHDTWHTATAVLGRTMMGALLLASNLKGQEWLTVKIQGQGPAGPIVVEADSQGHVRGFITQPHLALDLNSQGKLDVSQAVGLPGMLSVEKHMGRSQPFVGQVTLVSGEIAEDLTYYMAVSEQTPSSIGLSVLVNPDDTVAFAGGFMVQLMPETDEATIAGLETALNGLKGLSTYFKQADPVVALTEALFGQGKYKVMAEVPVAFHCDCSKERFKAGLNMLALNDLRPLAEEDHGAELICHYCNDHYYFSEVEIQSLIQEKEESGHGV